MDKDNLEDLLKRPLGEAETGLTTPNSSQMIMMTHTYPYNIKILMRMLSYHPLCFI